MKFKLPKLIFSTLVFIVIFTAIDLQNYNANNNKDTLFQVSTIDALLAGAYDGDYSFEQIKKLGDFGIGTVDKLDGELIAFDNNFYQIQSNGTVHELADSQTSPFVYFTKFQSNLSLNKNLIKDYKSLQEFLSSKIAKPNYFYAIRIDGKFKKLKLRAAPKQKKPYIALAEAIKDQAEFQFEDIEGTMIGFLLPEYMKGISVPGFHFHFVSKDKKSGGHVFNFSSLENAQINIDALKNFKMMLPNNAAFNNSNLKLDRQEALRKVEKQSSK